MTLSTQDLQNLKDRFSKLEMDIDAFSTVISRLSTSRRSGTSTGDTPAHRVSQKIASNTQEFASRGSAANGCLFLPAAMMLVLAAAAATLSLSRAKLNKVGKGREVRLTIVVVDSVWRWHTGDVGLEVVTNSTLYVLVLQNQVTFGASRRTILNSPAQLCRLTSQPIANANRRCTTVARRRRPWPLRPRQPKRGEIGSKALLCPALMLALLPRAT